MYCSVRLDSFSARHHRIHFGGVDKIHAMRHCVVEVVDGLRFRILFTESHGAGQTSDTIKSLLPSFLFHSYVKSYAC